MAARLQQSESSINDWAQSESQQLGIRVHREGYVSGRCHSFTHHHSGQCLPLVNDARIFAICMLPCRRSSHGDISLSLRLFALGLRANNRRLLWNLSRRVSIGEGPLLSWVFTDFLGYVHPFLCTSLAGVLHSFCFFARG